jgi:hypothetical protein
LPGDLVDDCIVWLAENFMLRLSDSQRAQIMRQLRSMFQNDNHTEQVGQRYKLFMDHLSRDAFEIEPIQAHLQQMFTNIEQRHNGPNNYLHRVFPAVVRFIPHGPSQQVGSLLHNLFSNAKGNPQVFRGVRSIRSRRYLDAGH